MPATSDTVLISLGQHEAGEHRHDHLVPPRHDVLGQRVDRGAEPPRRRHRVLGHGQQPRGLRLALPGLRHEAPVHRARLQGLNQLQNGDTVTDTLNKK